MSGHDHRHLLFVHGDSRVHRLRPQCKVVAAVLFILAVVATPREAIPAYGAYALVLAVVAHHARVPLSFVVRRLVIELPFVAFALFLPFVAGGEQVEVLGMALSSDGLWAAWNILVKGTLGVATTVILVATTPIGDLLEGLDRLRVPRPLTAVAGFMIRYAEVITEEARRMRIARESRGYHRVAVAGPGAGRLRRVAVPALVRAGRAGVPGDGVPGLRRGHAGARRPGGVAARVGHGAGPARPGRGDRLRGVGDPAVTGPALEVRDLAFAYPDGRQALFGCNLRVARGERLAILGPNGAGKTTLVLHLNGVLGGGEGEVVVGGLTVGRDTLKEIRRRVGIVFQDPDDQLFMPTVAQDVAFGPANMGLRGDELASRVKEALVAVGMDHHADRAPTTSASASGAGSPSPPCSPWTRRYWCSTSPRPTSTPRPGPSWRTSWSRST